MFGYITPKTGELLVKHHLAYRASYCGICRACGGRGCAPASAKLALRYDTVFLALFRLMLAETPPEVVLIRCPLHPFSRKQAIVPCSETVSAARHGALLFAHSLIDRAADTRGPKRLGYLLLRPYATHLRRKACGGEGDAALDALMEQKLSALRELEKAGNVSPDAAADPFATILAAVFAEGLPAQVQPHARALGYHLGRWITFADALDDWERDQKSGEFNLFLHADVTHERILDTMHLDLDAARRALACIPACDEACRAILLNILTLSLPEKTEALLTKLAKGTP